MPRLDTADPELLYLIRQEARRILAEYGEASRGLHDYLIAYAHGPHAHDALRDSLADIPWLQALYPGHPLIVRDDGQIYYFEENGTPHYVGGGAKLAHPQRR